MKSMKDSAVSPVIGVLLMLVVCIILAAVVSSFAGGLAGTTSATPSASIDVKIADNDGAWQFTMEHLSGDALPTKDLNIITSFTNSTGYTYKHTQTPASSLVSIWGGYADTRVPFLNDMKAAGGAAKAAAHFGNYTFKTGDIASTGDNAGTNELFGFNLTKESDFKSGATAQVDILHVPSQKLMYSKEVVIR